MFSNKVVLVTGGSAGIGAATAECFAKESANLAIVGRNETNLKEVAQRCEKLGAKVHIIKADISKDDEAKIIVQETINHYGKLDVLVNNAGIIKLIHVDQSNLVETYDEIMKTNLRAVVLLTNLAIPHLKETKGNIVNVSSVTSTNVKFPGIGIYGISKAGMDYFTRFSALELASSGVRVNSVNPGPVDTGLQTDVNAAEVVTPSIGSITELGRASDPEEVGDLILYLASDKAKSITGSCYVIDNGFLLK